MSLEKPLPAKPHPGSLSTTPGISLYGMYELTKPRLSILSVFTASLGYLVREPLQSDLSIFFSLTIGTALAAGGAAALNQWMERSEDALMARTVSRPIPAGLISPEFAIILELFSLLSASMCYGLEQTLGQPSSLCQPLQSTYYYTHR